MKLETLWHNKDWKIDHVEDFLDVMSTISNDKKFEKVKEKVVQKAEKEEITMISILDEAENRGIEQGRAAGLTEGLLLAKAILKLDKAGKSIQEIAMEFSMDEEEVRKFLEE